MPALRCLCSSTSLLHSIQSSKSTRFVNGRVAFERSPLAQTAAQATHLCAAVRTHVAIWLNALLAGSIVA